MNNDLNLDLSLSLLDGIHEDDHEKITILKNNSINDFSITNDLISELPINNSFIITFYKIKDLSNYIVSNNTNLLYLGCTSIMVGSIIKYLS